MFGVCARRLAGLPPLGCHGVERRRVKDGGAVLVVLVTVALDRVAMVGCDGKDRCGSRSGSSVSGSSSSLFAGYCRRCSNRRRQPWKARTQARRCRGTGSDPSAGPAPAAGYLSFCCCRRCRCSLSMSPSLSLFRLWQQRSCVAFGPP